MWRNYSGPARFWKSLSQDRLGELGVASYDVTSLYLIRYLACQVPVFIHPGWDSELPNSRAGRISH